MALYANLLSEADGGLTVVTVNRPGKLNALNRATIEALDAFFRDAGEDPSVRAIIVTGAGGKSFVAGADIEEVSGFTALEGREWGLRGQAMLRRIETIEKPVIAAINGYALGGGLELAMACHIRVASTRARLGQPELKLGIVPGFGGTQRLPRLVGKGRALEMLLTGDPVSAQEALAMGLVNRVAEPDRLLDAARSLAARILRNGPLAVALTIQSVNRGCEMPLAEALDWEVSQYALSCATDDVREGTRAFLEKRAPRFRGR
jgi:enoyl-CoA hydratase